MGAYVLVICPMCCTYDIPSYYIIEGMFLTSFDDFLSESVVGLTIIRFHQDETINISIYLSEYKLLPGNRSSGNIKAKTDRIKITLHINHRSIVYIYVAGYTPRVTTVSPVSIHLVCQCRTY